MLKDVIKVGIFGGTMTGIVYAMGRLDGRIEMAKVVKEIIKRAGEK